MINTQLVVLPPLPLEMQGMHSLMNHSQIDLQSLQEAMMQNSQLFLQRDRSFPTQRRDSPRRIKLRLRRKSRRHMSLLAPIVEENTSDRWLVRADSVPQPGRRRMSLK